MLWKKLACSVAALLALTAAYVRPVCTVSLGGQELPGLWAPGDVAGAERVRGAKRYPAPERTCRRWRRI